MTQARKVRGMATQRLAAEWFQDRGFPYAESTGAGRPGRDITGMPGVAVEVKARASLDPIAWLRQAEATAAGDLPCVVFRPNGFGPATVHEWGVLMRLDTFTQLIRDAGYGDGPTVGGAA